MTALGFLDQTYFVLGLCSNWEPNRLAEHAPALKTLMLPGGLGSTMKVMMLGKGVGPAATARLLVQHARDMTLMHRWHRHHGGQRSRRRSRGSSRSRRGTHRSRGPASSCLPMRLCIARAVIRGFDRRRMNSCGWRSRRFRFGSYSRASTSFSTTGTTRACPENFWLRQFGYAWSFATIGRRFSRRRSCLRSCAAPHGRSNRRRGAGATACTACGRAEFDRLGGAVLWIALGADHADRAVRRFLRRRALPCRSGLARVHFSARSDQRAARRRDALARARRSTSV